MNVLAMIDGNGAGIPALKNDLLNFLKYGGNPTCGPLTVREFMMYHLIGSIYGAGIHISADTWTVYPGSSGGPNEPMGPFVKLGARLFRDQYVGDLLTRHTKSIDSGQAHDNKISVDFGNQINTVHVNPSQLARVRGKSVVVVDDFVTQGYSLECARNLLFESGAEDVTCVNIGKYGRRYNVITPVPGYEWDPFIAEFHQDTSFQRIISTGQTDPTALKVIQDSHARTLHV